MKERRLTNNRFFNLSFLWLFGGFILMAVGNGNWAIPLATWLAPIFILRFLRSQKLVFGAVIGILANILVYSIAIYIMLVTVPMIIRVFLMVLLGLIFFIPFLVDRLTVPGRNHFISTLIFPLTYCSVEHVLAIASPYGTWFSLAYTQYGNLALIQIASITGRLGLVFLICWFASVVNWAWEQNFSWLKVRNGLGLYASIFILTMLFGGIRLSFFPPNSDSVRVASVVRSIPALSDIRKKAGCSQKDLNCIRKAFAQSNNALFNSSKQGVKAGAKMIFWQEAAAVLLKKDEAALIEAGSELARQEQIYLGMSVYTVIETHPEEWAEIKSILIDTTGRVVWEYLKSHPVPGARVKPGIGVVPVHSTPFGKIGAVICYDADFPRLVLQAGKAEVDLMSIPANDWEEIKPLHTNMSVFRAVENGFSIIRPTGNGISAAFDYQGRVLSSMDSFKTKQTVMISDVPTKGVKTIYSLFGYFFDWLCIIGFLIMIVWSILQRQKTNN